MEVMKMDQAPQGWPGRILFDALMSPAEIDSPNGYNPYGDLLQGPLLPRPIPLFERPEIFDGDRAATTTRCDLVG
jgi:hypothetical protein